MDLAVKKNINFKLSKPTKNICSEPYLRFIFLPRSAFLFICIIVVANLKK
jgi:hypothetical protein